MEENLISEERKIKISPKKTRGFNGSKNRDKRLGEINITNEGYEAKIVKYQYCDDITVELNDIHKTLIETTYSCFRLGTIKNPNHPNKYGGYVGIGNYSAKSHPRIFNTWNSLFSRCCNEEKKKELPTYKDASLCEEWYCFQNFAEWFTNYPTYNKLIEDGVKFELDKDILVKGNKLYSPSTCCLVPTIMNAQLIGMLDRQKRGDLPVGMSIKKEFRDKGKPHFYLAQCDQGRDENGKRICPHIGYFTTPEDAFYAYKPVKEKRLKFIGDDNLSKGYTIEEVYNAFINYPIEITD